MLKLLIQQSAYLIVPKWAATVDERLWLSKQARRLRKRCSNLRHLEEVVEEFYKCVTFPASQKKAEILGLLKLLKEIQPRYVCEIGARSGGTLFLFCQVAAPDARILSIDINYTPAQQHAFRHFARPGQKTTCLAVNSHLGGTLDRVRKWLGDQEFDFLFIDGDHSLSGVSSDYSMYAPLVRPGGIIALHDIVPDFMTRYGIATASYVGEVPAFWSHLKRSGHNTRELIEDSEQDGFGIGVLQGKKDL